MTQSSNGLKASDATAGQGGVLLIGSDPFQRQAIDLMVEPSSLPVFGRFDLSAAGAAASVSPGGRRSLVLITTPKGLQRLLRQRRRPLFPTVRILVVAPLEEVPGLLYRLEREEMLGCLSGCIPPERMGEIGAEALRVAMQGVTVLPPVALNLLLDEERLGIRVKRLLEEERRLLELLTTGASNAEIAQLTGMPLSRVRNLVRSLLAKLGCRSRTAAAIIAHRYLEAPSLQRELKH